MTEITAICAQTWYYNVVIKILIMKSVTIYTTSTCGYCKMAKEFFKQNKVEYKEVNVEQDPTAAQKMITKSGQMGVPVIDVEGQIIVGFDQPKLTELLAIA